VVRIRDPRSGIRKKIIPDPWGKKAPDPGSGSATLKISIRLEKSFKISIRQEKSFKISIG
jgi:hypothetical protein